MYYIMNSFYFLHKFRNYIYIYIYVTIQVGTYLVVFESVNLVFSEKLKMLLNRRYFIKYFKR